jgi:hypothetical protein
MCDDDLNFEASLDRAAKVSSGDDLARSAVALEIQRSGSAPACALSSMRQMRTRGASPHRTLPRDRSKWPSRAEGSGETVPTAGGGDSPWFFPEAPLARANPHAKAPVGPVGPITMDELTTASYLDSLARPVDFDAMPGAFGDHIAFSALAGAITVH